MDFIPSKHTCSIYDFMMRLFKLSVVYFKGLSGAGQIICCLSYPIIEWHVLSCSGYDHTGSNPNRKAKLFIKHSINTFVMFFSDSTLYLSASLIKGHLLANEVCFESSEWTECFLRAVAVTSVFVCVTSQLLLWDP